LVLLKKNIRTLNYLNTNQKRNSNEWLAENSWQFAEVKGHAAPHYSQLGADGSEI